MAVGEKKSRGWQQCFPFVGDFESVVDGRVKLEYLERLVCVLESVVGVLTDCVENGQMNAVTVRAMFYCVAALSRIKVVQAYGVEIADEVYSRENVLEVLNAEWIAIVARDGLVEVAYTEAVGAMLQEGIDALWMDAAVSGMVTARDLYVLYGPAVSSLRVVALNGVYVQSDRGVLLSEVTEAGWHRPVLPAGVYRTLLSEVQRMRQQKPSVSRLQAVSACAGLDVGIVCDGVRSTVVSAWLWLLMSMLEETAGYCYQLLLPCSQRYVACMALGECPTVAELLWYLGDGNEVIWTECPASVSDGDVLHVVEAGQPDLSWLRGRSEKRIGMLTANKGVTADYYARALVDEFLQKHRAVPDAAAVEPPVDVAFETLSVSTDESGGREFIDIAKMLYSAVDEVVSPRAAGGEHPSAGFGIGDDHVTERDSELIAELYARLTDGPVISEEYFDKVYRRFKRMRRRPRLTESDGRLFHVFEGFPMDGGGGPGPWELDPRWHVPGWQSYVAEFEAGDSRTVSFSVDGGCQDVRMDCTGEGAIELGDCKLLVDGTVLWFTNSIRMRVVAKVQVTLRISVPDARSALAFGKEMRRYMHIPGYTIVVRNFSVVTGRVDVDVPMERVKRSSIAGCHVYSGQRYLERGRHRFKLSQISSVAPARILVKTDPPEALAFVSACGMRLHPRTRDHVSLLIDLRNVELYVDVSQGATLVISMVQVVRAREFELAAASVRTARADRRNSDGS